jgi:tetratricopeptide (TPR) repeat protein
MRRSAVLLFALMCAFAGPVHAASDKDLADCENDADLDRLIAACTRVGQDRKEDSETRSDAYYNIGQAYSRKDDRDRSLAAYGEAIRLNRKNTWAIYNRASGYLAKRDYNRAIADSSAGIRIDPKVPLGYANRAIAYHVKRNFDAALADYEAALKLDPKLPYALHGRGLIRISRGDAAGEADIAAARAIGGEAATLFTAHGLK